MSTFKRFWEWYLGLPPVDAGEGTAWKFDWRAPWPGWLPAWLVLVLAVGLLAAVVAIYLRDARSASPRMRGALLGCRLAAIAVLLVFLSGATLSVARMSLPAIVVLIDTSASMGLEDEYRDAATSKAVRELIDEARLDPGTRLALARAILTRDDARLLRRLQSRHKLRVYRFDETARPVTTGDAPRDGELGPLIEAIDALAADGASTRPGPALRKALDDLRGTPPSAVVIFTDGITSTTDADRLSTAIDAARRRGVPVFTVGLGSAAPARDLQMYDMLAPELAFADDPLALSARLRQFGYEGRNVTVRLKRRDTDEVLGEKTVVAPADGESTKVEFVHTPTQEGEIELALEAVPGPDETDASNNSESRRISVRNVKVRVLLVDSLPRAEFIFLKQFLERQPTIELHTVLQDADLEFATDDETALEHFPVRREDLFRYDVIVFGDVNPGLLSADALRNLNDFVSTTGGGVLFVAGTHHAPAAYRGTAIEPLVPVDLSSLRTPPPDAVTTQSFRPELTAEGRNWSTIFRFADGEEESLRIWRGLPPLYWLVEAPDLKRGAVVFAEHPARSGGERNLPLVVMQRVGAGKVLFHATDETWRWRLRTRDSYFGRYWIQAIRYLSRSKLLETDRTAELDSDRRVYQRGETVRLSLKFLDERLIPAEDDGVTVMVERGGEQRTVPMTRLPQEPNVFEGRFSDAAEGPYHAWVISPAFREKPPVRDFRVEAPAPELRRRALDRAELQRTAQATHGRFFTPADVDELPEAIPQGNPVPLDSHEPIPLWNRWELLVLFAGLLGTEWMLRKRARLV
ncbi:MAG: VWA domain-containing protein [Planctomycetaceae bacterium]